MAAAGSESIEHETLTRFLDKLVTAFKASHLTISNELVSKRVIPNDVHDKMVTMRADDETKATLIMKSMLDQVKVCPRKYDDFMRLPSFDDECFCSLYKEITAVYGTCRHIIQVDNLW